MDSFSGLLVNYAKKVGSSVIVRAVSYTHLELEVVQAKQKEAREKEARAISNEEKAQARSELMELQREQMAIMKKYNAMPLTVGGCLPLLIQMPFLTGLFFTLSNPLYSAGIIDSTFLGVFSLGTRSYILPVIAFIVYAIQTRLAMRMTPQVTQPGQAVSYTHLLYGN